MLELLLGSRVSPIQLDFNNPDCRFHTFDDWRKLGQQKQWKMIRLSNVGEGCDSVSISNPYGTRAIVSVNKNLFLIGRDESSSMKY